MDPRLDNAPDGWYRELSVDFPDGSREIFHIQRKPTGTHIPLLRGKPEPWTDLSFHKCPGCPLPAQILSCPAALSLQTTLGKLRTRSSIEEVKATAIDASGRSQTVEWALQTVGSTLVQLAVFASGCPVGRRFKPYLEGLPPFVSSLDLSRRIASKILEQHGGSLEAAKNDLLDALRPLHEVFVHLGLRLRKQGPSGGEPFGQDAIPNSIAQVDAFAQVLSFRADGLLKGLSAELGWNAAQAPKPAAAGESGGVWSKVKSLFS